MTPVSGKDVRITPLRAVCVDVTVSFHCCVSFLGNKVAQTWGGGGGEGLKTAGSHCPAVLEAGSPEPPPSPGEQPSLPRPAPGGPRPFSLCGGVTFVSASVVTCLSSLCPDDPLRRTLVIGFGPNLIQCFLIIACWHLQRLDFQIKPHAQVSKVRTSTSFWGTQSNRDRWYLGRKKMCLPCRERTIAMVCVRPVAIW